MMKAEDKTFFDAKNVQLWNVSKQLEHGVTRYTIDFSVLDAINVKETSIILQVIAENYL